MDDDEDMGTTPEPPSTPATGIRPTISWHTPAKLPDRTDVTPPTVASVERQIQSTRMSSVTEARYASDFDIPKSPAPMTDVEQALDMTSQASAMTASIPFFVPAPTPAQAPAAAPAPTPAPAPAYDFSQPPAAHTPPATTAAPPQTGSVPATAETVQALGLPMFLVGQNVQALQTLASTPSLLSTFVDSSGMYDQTRLMSLVQTLSQNIPPAPAPAAPAAAPPMGGYQPYQQQSTSSYGPPGGQQQSYQSGNTSAGMYGPASTSTYGPAGGSGGWNSGGMRPSNGYRGDGNTEGNLHLSGYGPMTTQADIIQLFAPYVQVDEVVMKQNFSFVNTSNPVGAQQAREALNGALLGGQPVRINVATRKKKEPMPPYGGGGNNAPSMYGNAGMGSSISTQPPPANPYGAPPAAAPPAMGGMQPAGMGGMPQQDPSTVRDDRGNPATKNLFVAGYGPGTTEMQIRELFGQYANIVGIIVKGTFSFVNTSDRSMAVAARAALGGTMMNGGVLRINFAKETGRLGTSFDLGYSNAGGTRGPPGGPPPPSHYGRSY
jgi:RNA recognition motif-containing protein